MKDYINDTFDDIESDIYGVLSRINALRMDIDGTPNAPCAITDLLQQKFQSGNNVPVERVTITRSEYEAALRSKNNG